MKILFELIFFAPFKTQNHSIPFPIYKKNYSETIQLPVILLSISVANKFWILSPTNENKVSVLKFISPFFFQIILDNFSLSLKRKTEFFLLSVIFNQNVHNIQLNSILLALITSNRVRMSHKKQFAVDVIIAILSNVLRYQLKSTTKYFVSSAS